MARKKTKKQKQASTKRRITSPLSSQDSVVAGSLDTDKNLAPTDRGKFSLTQLGLSKTSSIQKPTKTQSLLEQSKDILGYDYRLILADLRVTVVVTIVLVLALVFMSWYLPFGLNW